MASYHAVRATCKAIMHILKQNWDGEITGNTPVFQVCTVNNIEQSPGVSLFLYKVMVNEAQRTLPAKPDQDGQRRRAQLLLDLHFILLPRAEEASLQHVILGWMMRTLEDYPTIPTGLLDNYGAETSTADEIVEIIAGRLTNEEMFRIFDLLPLDFQLAVPYVARPVRIDSRLTQSVPSIVEERHYKFGLLKDE